MSLRSLFSLAHVKGDFHASAFDPRRWQPLGTHVSPEGEVCTKHRSKDSRAVYHSITRTDGPITWEAGAIGQCPKDDAFGDAACRCGLAEPDVPYSYAQKHAAACTEVAKR